jgi:erythromycin esterase
VKHLCVVVACALALLMTGANAQQAQTRRILPGDSFEVGLKPGQDHSYSLMLGQGESALIVVRQLGVDVIVEVTDSQGGVIATIDSPNGRNGDEVVPIEADVAGLYSLRVRPFDANEPAAKFSMQFAWQRDARETTAAVETARQWLARSSAEIPASGIVAPTTQFGGFGQWLNGVRVVGLGEATHGSRELGDLRFSLTRLLVERHGFRIVAIEASEDKYHALAAYVSGEAAAPSPVLPGPGWIWIGRRSQRDLIEWVRSWNLAHPDDRVRIVGTDANDNSMARETLGRFIAEAHDDPALAKRWSAAAAELAAADEQSFVFGDSGVNAATRQFLLELNAAFVVDAAILRARFGAEFTAARDAAETLLEFADFNSDGEAGALSRSRDWYMAGRVLRAIHEGGPRGKAVYWAHNAHVVHRKGSTRAAGELLRSALGRGYAAIATTFGEGEFVAQIPNGAANRLAVSRVPAAPPSAVEGMFARVRPGGSFAVWNSDLVDSETPEWFHVPRQMHWVGGLYRPDAIPTEAFQPYMVLSDFDGVAYLPRVAAEDMPADRPRIPARRR